jgi:hypothetical protein
MNKTLPALPGKAPALPPDAFEIGRARPLDHPAAVAVLLDALREVGAHEQAVDAMTGADGGADPGSWPGADDGLSHVPAQLSRRYRWSRARRRARVLRTREGP